MHRAIKVLCSLASVDSFGAAAGFMVVSCHFNVKIYGKQFIDDESFAGIEDIAMK